MDESATKHKGSSKSWPIIEFIRRRIRWVVAVGLLAIPLMGTAFFSEAGYVRLAGVALGLVVFLGGTLFYALSPKAKIIKSRAKLNRAGLERQNRIVTGIIRVTCGALALVLIYVAVLLVADVLTLAEKGPVEIQGRVKVSNSPFGLWPLYQGIALAVENEECTYYLFYSPRGRLKRGGAYALRVLPRTRLVLEFEEAQDDIR